MRELGGIPLWRIPYAWVVLALGVILFFAGFFLDRFGVSVLEGYDETVNTALAGVGAVLALVGGGSSTPTPPPPTPQPTPAWTPAAHPSHTSFHSVAPCSTMLSAMPSDMRSMQSFRTLNDTVHAPSMHSVSAFQSEMHTAGSAMGEDDDIVHSLASTARIEHTTAPIEDLPTTTTTPVRDVQSVTQSYHSAGSIQDTEVVARLPRHQSTATNRTAPGRRRSVPQRTPGKTTPSTPTPGVVTPTPRPQNRAPSPAREVATQKLQTLLGKLEEGSSANERLLGKVAELMNKRLGVNGTPQKRRTPAGEGRDVQGGEEVGDTYRTISTPAGKGGGGGGNAAFRGISPPRPIGGTSFASVLRKERAGGGGEDVGGAGGGGAAGVPYERHSTAARPHSSTYYGIMPAQNARRGIYPTE